MIVVVIVNDLFSFVYEAVPDLDGIAVEDICNLMFSRDVIVHLGKKSESDVTAKFLLNGGLYQSIKRIDWYDLLNQFV